MVGAFATGKTSLVARFVKTTLISISTTVGVKVIPKWKFKESSVRRVKLVCGICTEDEFQNVSISYLRDLSLYLVVDGTRHIHGLFFCSKRVEEIIRKVPFIMIINKSDLTEDRGDWRRRARQTITQGWTVIKGAQKTGLGVEESSLTLAKRKSLEDRCNKELMNRSTADLYCLGYGMEHLDDRCWHNGNVRVVRAFYPDVTSRGNKLRLGKKFLFSKIFWSTLKISGWKITLGPPLKSVWSETDMETNAILKPQQCVWKNKEDIDFVSKIAYKSLFDYTKSQETSLSIIF